MKKKGMLFCLKIAASVYAACFLGGMFDFCFFPADDMVVREIIYCTVVICVTIAVCANRICRYMDQHSQSDREDELG